MPNIKIDDLEFNTEDFDEVENKFLADIKLCEAKLSLLGKELRLFEVVKAHLSAQISQIIRDKTPKD